MAESLRNKSRRDWGNDANSNDQIQLGCLLRIADATEKMAQRHTELIDERDRANRSAELWRNRAEHAERSARSLRGQNTKLRKKLAQACAPKEGSHD